MKKTIMKTMTKTIIIAIFFLFLVQSLAAESMTEEAITTSIIERPCAVDSNGNAYCRPCNGNYGAYECLPPIIPEQCYNTNNDYRKCKTPNIDIIFAIDSTGSMADEIRSVKYHIKNIVQRVQSGTPQPKVRIGVAAYRDYKKEEEEYVTKKLKLTADVNEALAFIENIIANGGGDTPEAVEAGLKEGLAMRWDDEARKMIFLIGDAPPHGIGSDDYSYQNGPPANYNYKDMIREAQEKQVRIFTISGSGMDSNGIQVWQEIALKTGGSYTHLQYERVYAEEYFADQEIDAAYASEARASPDYDYATGTIQANNLAEVAEKAIMAEAASAGVVYDNAASSPIEDRREDFPSDKFFLPQEVIIEENYPDTQPVRTIWGKIINWIIFWR